VDCDGAPEFARRRNMNIFHADPLSDDRWNDLVRRHPNASAFHQRGWLQALARTYGYEPLVLTTAPPGCQLTDGLVLCRISSWLTGKRLVALPFSDHCDLLLDEGSDLWKFVSYLREEHLSLGEDYVEVRPLTDPWGVSGVLRLGSSYWFHELDLRDDLDTIFRRMHRDSIQRKIQKAEREHLTYDVGRSELLMEEFYRLLLITRRRHRMLPQPRSWFRNLIQYMGEGIEIRVARKNGIPLAAIFSLRYRSSVIYKYSCSDARFHSLGSVPFLIWRFIEESKASGIVRIDLGRSSLDNLGLIVFKDKLGASRKLLNYYRCTRIPDEKTRAASLSKCLKGLLGVLPNVLLPTAGGIIYKHIG
jgi:hypothetical protein